MVQPGQVAGAQPSAGDSKKGSLKWILVGVGCLALAAVAALAVGVAAYFIYLKSGKEESFLKEKGATLPPGC